MSCVDDLLVEWIRESDSHAAHRLPLMERAERILSGSETATSVERTKLAAALERWRYQHLGNLAGQWADSDRQLVDTLDDLARRLSDAPPRGPRNPRAALADATLDIDNALSVLDESQSLEAVSRRVAQITAAHFSRPVDAPPGTQRRRMLLYAPLYLSSYCTNHCTYCGFQYPAAIQRRHLELPEAQAEARLLAERGFQQVLLVAGDFPRLTSVQYYADVVRTLAAQGLTASVEIAPQPTAAYRQLVEAGAQGVTLYQETYDQRRYAEHHQRGTKTAYDWRLEGPERALEAGFARLGLGILVGLADPRQDLLALIRHGRYLKQRFPDRTFAFSLPRIHDAPAEFQIPFPVSDELFVRMYAALRIAFPQAELVLSTREPPALRAQLAHMCVTQMSAGSSTVPGGYGDPEASDLRDGQFPVTDHRSAAEVATWLEAAGFLPLWSDR